MTRTRAHQIKSSLLASAATLATMFVCGTAQAETAQPAPEVVPVPATATPAPPPVPSEEIVITGTRRTDRTVTNSASPIDVISAQELTSQPSANLLDTVKNIVPSFYVPQNSISDASSFVRAPSLRGLPADEVLVQINGKRFNRSALVQVYVGGDTGLGFGSQGADISAIPAIAIKNLQVLRDGATAQYGSDAIAGVMNFGMRNDRNNLELQARYGQTFDHGHTRLDSGRSRQIAGTAGIGIGATGYFDVAGEWYKEDGTSTGETRPVAAIFAAENPGLASQLPNYPLPVQIWGSSPNHGWKGMVNAGIDVTDNSQVYFTGIGARNHANESFNYRSPITRTAVDVGGITHTLGRNGAFSAPFFLTPCPAGNLTCPAGGYVHDTNTFLFTDLYPAGFTPRFVGITKERWGTAGWRGELAGGLTWDLSGTIAKNTLTLSMYSSLSPTYGPQSQTEFEFGTLSQKERNANLDFTYPIELGLASPLTLAWGGEYRKEIYGQSEGDPQSYGAGPFASPQVLFDEVAPGVFAPTPYVAGSFCAGAPAGDPPPTTCVIPGRAPGASGYGGTSPTYAGSWSQWSWGVYGDAEADITDQLSMGLAGRYEHYNTFGGSFVYKLNGIYKVTPQFSVRGTIGTGFHAPSPGQAHDAILTTNFVAGNQVQTGTYPVDSPISQFYGSTTLKPEKSRNYGAGVVIKPTPSITMTIDGYIINVRGRIGISQTYHVTAADILAQPELAAVGEGGDVNFFTNASNTSTKGIDFVGTWRHDMFDGHLTTTLAYNYNKSKVTKFDPAVISPEQRDVVAHLAPNHRATLSANFVRGPWTLNARENYYSWWRDELDYPGQKFGSEFTTDLDLSYDFMRHFRVTVGANNIFNNRPDRIANTATNPIYVLTGSTADGQVYPRLGGPFGINGGFWYVKLAAHFTPFAMAAPVSPIALPPPPPATQTCADGTVVAVGAACPVMAPPPPPPPPPAPTERGERG
ncbi:MAG TPA: TonB-dependent receptor [Sphingomicrobium sp.]|nr:TonB-dependent receptor [Sphingomicrobium sp.]